ncbi:DUF1735 domain-containing protein [uncultured Dysgonomonas sp.]|uniref:BT-3987-like N-terminal domain-containing protein n=1 Tax=uncultured Dysgonomonas sp. TaxID=206096 RepID=A0A212JCR3_9BACT|nr:DUF1735 domain-containing protein [uncultured Dysgonomonas sp.]SBV97237.1 conserved hypothetical protein [uncultured Dysgonomonas sp.]
MKTTINFFKIGMIALIALLSTSCDDIDSEKEWGNALLYISQSTIQSGGTNCNYTVVVKNIASDTTVVVGVYRSGLQELKAVEVNLSIDNDSLTQAIARSSDPAASSDFNIYKTAKLLPANYYTIPEKISIKNGNREGYADIILNRKALYADPFFVAGNRYILPLRISNPTRYELNSKLSLTMFIFEPF